MVGVDTFALFPILGGMCSAYHHLYNTSYRIFIYASHHVEEVPFCFSKIICRLQ